MFSIWFAVVGLLAFAGGAAYFGARLRRGASKADAERSSRIMHALFFGGLGCPFLVAAAYPGLSHLDGLLGLTSFSGAWRWVAGAVLGLPGLTLMGASNRLLRTRGHGANAFRLTGLVVEGDLYSRTRSPMSLGYYLAAAGLALWSGSTALVWYVALGIVPAHIFFLRYFEEKELELRLGATYAAYRQRVPFLWPRL